MVERVSEGTLSAQAGTGDRGGEGVN